MADLFLGEPSNVGVSGGEISTMAPAKCEKPDHSISEWSFNREEIENSPSRKDGIDLRTEAYLRRSYSAFIQDLGMGLNISQVTIATAITLCHRFFHRQSHAKNDRHIIATVCMFLAAKVEETPRPLRDVILVSWEILSKKNPIYLQSIKQKDFYEQQKQLVLFGETVVLTNLGFDLNVCLPYKPVLLALMKFKLRRELIQVALNFVNDGLRTSLCLQFKPHQIAAGVIFLTAKFLKLKLPFDSWVAWWQEFKVTPQQLEEIINQILELYEQTYNATASHANEPAGSLGVSSSQMAGKSQSNSEVTPSRNAYSQFCNIYSTAEADCGFEVPQAKETGQRRKAVVGEYNKNSLKYAYSYSYGKDDSTLDTRPSVDSGWTGKTVSSVNHHKPNTKKYLNGNRFSRLKVNEGDTGTLVEREGYKLHNDGLENQTRGMIQSILTQDIGLPVNSKCMGKPAVSANRLGHNNKKFSDQKFFRQSQANEVEKRTLEERKVNILDASGLGNETGGRIQSNGSDQFSSIQISDINKDKVSEALERRRKSRRKERDSRPEILESEIVDEDALIEFELESGLEAAVKAEKAKEKRKKIRSRSCYRSEQGSLKTRQEHVDGGGHGLKKKRSNEGKGKIRECSSDKADLPDRRQEMFPADCLDDEREEGELPNSPLHELVHSPRPSGSWSQASSCPDNGRSTINRHNYHSRDGSNGARNEYRSRDSKIRECSSDKADLPDRRQEMFPADCLDDEREEGELPNSPLQELVHSPRSSGSWSQASSRPDNGRITINRHNYHSRDGSNGGHNEYRSMDSSDGGCIRHRSRDGSEDSKRYYSHCHRHHFYNRQHILNAERDCHRSNDRDDDDWKEPSYKKRRHDHGR